MSISNPITHEWSSYLDCLPDQIRHQFDVHQDCLDLEKQSSRLFSGEGGVEVWRRENGAAIKTCLNLNTTEIDDVVYVFHQRNSWSALDGNLADLRNILTRHRVSPKFLEVIHSFGSKVTGDDDAYFNVCDAQTFNEGSNSIHEYFYLLRTYEKHGRSNLKDPWSLRQMALYRRHESQTSQTIWILIQPFLEAKVIFLKAFGAQANHGTSREEDDNSHIFLTAALQNWRWYLDHRRRTAAQFMEKAVHSSSAIKHHDYTTGFSDCQKLQKLTVSLSLAQHILCAQQDICLMLAGTGTRPDLMRKTAHQAEGFTRTAARLEKSAEGTSQLMSKLLEYRKSDQLNAQAALLATLTQQTNAQTRSLHELASESRSDSRYTKILSFVATLYLPASLLASVFSSDLIQLPRVPSDLLAPPVLYVSQAIWVFALVSVCLAGITLAGTIWFTKRMK